MATKNLPAAPGIGLTATVTLTVMIPPLTFSATPTNQLVTLAQQWCEQRWRLLLQNQIDNAIRPSASELMEIWTVCLWIHNVKTLPPVEAP